MKSLLKFLKNRRGATGIEYAFLVGLVALVVIGALAATGGRVEWAFDRASCLIGSDCPPDDGTGTPGGNGGNETLAPTAQLEVDLSELHSGGTVTFTWATTDATTLSAGYTLDGDCAKLTNEGSGPFSLGFATPSGTQTMSWSSDLAGCTIEASIEAQNVKGSAPASASFSAVPFDGDPDAFTFTALTNQIPGATVTSNTVTLAGFDTPLALTISSTGDTPQYALNGGSLQSITSAGTTASINPGDTLQLSIKVAAAAAIHVKAGTVETDWLVAPPVHGKQVFTSNGSFSVPAGVTQIAFKAWGAGGGGTQTLSAGGAGGYASGAINVSAISSLAIIVGSHGDGSTVRGVGSNNVNGSTNGGGGSGGDAYDGDDYPGASGGGRSAIRDGSVELVTAAGGGGAGGHVCSGGAGGGAVGQNGGAAGSATGGSLSVGGIHGQGGGGGAGTDGTQFQGGAGATGFGSGNGFSNGGGGGGGYYGGGGGGSLSSNPIGCGAGGGSSYVGGAVGGSTIGGSNAIPPSTGDADYVTGVGKGGNSAGGVSKGGDGLVVISW